MRGGECCVWGGWGWWAMREGCVGKCVWNEAFFFFVFVLFVMRVIV